MNVAVEIHEVTHKYLSRVALQNLSFNISAGQIFAILGPNGSGKTTLFRLLSTLMPLQTGKVLLLGHDLQFASQAIRLNLGVVFQTSSLDKKLTVAENLLAQASFYGIRAGIAKQRIQHLLTNFNLLDRQHDLAERLSGGQRRRVEIAKSMLHEPQLLLLDEPSTGLDPGARLDLWHMLENLISQGITVVLTTHLLEEAAKAKRIAIFDSGKLVAHDTPAALQATIGGDALTLKTRNSNIIAQQIRDKFQLHAIALPDAVRLEIQMGHTWIARLIEAFPGQIEEVYWGKPSLEDVFIAKTGHRFYDAQENSV